MTVSWCPYVLATVLWYAKTPKFFVLYLWTDSIKTVHSVLVRQSRQEFLGMVNLPVNDAVRLVMFFKLLIRELHSEVWMIVSNFKELSAQMVEKNIPFFTLLLIFPSVEYNEKSFVY